MGFNPHTHEGCDFNTLMTSIIDLVSIHTPTKGVTINNCTVLNILGVSIHTPTKGVTFILAKSGFSPRSFNPHTHEGCDFRFFEKWWSCNCFNPHTHEGCDLPVFTQWVNPNVSIHTPTKGVTFTSCLSVTARTSFNPHTHEGCDIGTTELLRIPLVSIHTPTKGVTYVARRFFASPGVSIHTPTKGVTAEPRAVDLTKRFQSTHPRRVWLLSIWFTK